MIPKAVTADTHRRTARPAAAARGGSLLGGRERSLNGPFSGNELDPFLIRTEKGWMDGWTSRQAAEEPANREAVHSFFGPPIRHANNWKTTATWTRRKAGRSRALGCTRSAQMTTIHTNIPVQVRESATNSQQMEVVQGRRALVLEALAWSVWCIVEERFSQRTHP